MNFTLYTSNQRGNTTNCIYQNKFVITDEKSLSDAARFDHVAALYENNRRSNDNFKESDCIMMDFDNDHSEKPSDWITPLDIALEFPEVAFAAVYSRNNMKQKGGKAARPKFHAYFTIPICYDVESYAEIKKRLYTIYPYFDSNALDGARFCFGVDNPEVEIYDGNKMITDVLVDEFEEWDTSTEQIPEGQRNSAMSRIAGKLVIRYGNTDETYNMFLKESEKCNPPLPDFELKSIWNSATKFGKKVSSQDGYIPPEEYNKGYSLKPDDYSDIGQAKVLSREYSGELVYTDATEYMRYDGTHWVESRQLAIGACEEFLDRQLEDAIKAVSSAESQLVDSGIDKELIKLGGKALEKAIDDKKSYERYMSALMYKNFVMKRRDMKYVLSALQAAKPMLLRSITDFDSNGFLLNTPSGTYDLQMGLDGFKEASSNDCITKMTLVSPSDENMDVWLKTLNNMFGNDNELIEYVQQISGLAAIGRVYVEALIIAYGEGGNGKSTFWNTIARVLGSYSGAISADALTVGCKRNVKPEMAELKGKRLVIAAELEEGMRLNTSIVKQLCSTDEVSAEKKYKDPFKYIPTHTLVLYTNHLPKVGACDDGTWRRLIVIPFNSKIKSDIKNYADYLVENAGGAVLSWIIEGAKKAIDNDFNFKVPKAVKDAIEKYKSNNDWLSNFIDDCCEIDTSYSQKSGELYQEYRNYCGRMGEYTRSTTDFYTSLETIGCNKKKTNRGNYVTGIRLKSEFV